MADINILYARRDSIIKELETVRFEIQSVKDTLARRRQELPQIERDLNNSRLNPDLADLIPSQTALLSRQQGTISTLDRRLAELLAQEARLEAELAEVNRQISRAQIVEGESRQSAGQTVQGGQTARAEGASPTNPPPVEQTLDSNEQVVDIRDLPASNAQRPQTGTAAQDAGTDGRLRTQRETQSIPPNTAATPPPPTPGGPRPASTPGAAAASDDVRASINAIFGGQNAKITTQPNVLDKYASYSYSISIYLMSPQDYVRLIRNKQKNLAGYNLLIQSAGIPISTGFGRQPDVAADVGEIPGVTTFSQDAGRNEYFQEDFYIDDLRIKSLISGKGTAGPHNVATMEFRIIEPNGITLLPRLYKAVQAYVAGSGGTAQQNYAAQNFLMVIRFYGYDTDGNQYLPVKGQLYDDQGNPAPATTPQVIEKFIPFQFQSIKFRVADKITEYSCEAVCPQNLIATGPARGVIPYNVEITSKTLQQLFNGPVAFSSPPRTGTDANQTDAETQRLIRQAAAAVTSEPQQLGSTIELEIGITPAPSINPVASNNQAPPKASAANTPVITQGLAQALNQFQADLVAKGVYTIPDNYRIEVLTPALQNSQVVPPGEVNQRKVPMGPGPTAPANQQKNPATQSQDKNAGTTSAYAGMSILQFIDQYTRTSTYIYNQQIRIIDPKTGRPRENGTPAEVTAWYRVGLQAVPRLSAGYDPKRNDYAYDITYQLSPYKVNDVQSDFFPQARFQGAHKKYNYWFTGENTQILRFEQDFNYLYYLTINTEQVARQLNVTSDYREYLKKAFSPRSAQSAMGQQGATNEPSANAADYLYSPADQGRVRMEIVGDPAWIQQGELWAGIAGAGQAYGPFLDDGTVNYEGQEALFEIAFNQPVDYNLDTGIMDPTTNNYNKTDTSAGAARQSYVYRATEVISVFSQGRFTQELNGVLIFFDLPRTAQADQSERDVATQPNQSQAETRRLQASAAAAAPTSFQDRQRAAAAIMGNARREQLNSLVDLVSIRSGPLATDSLQAEGFAAPAQEAAPPSSSGQIIGPTSTPTSVFGQYGALGAGTGSPAVTFTTQTGRVVTAQSQQDITNAFNAGFINRVVANELTSQLNGLQQQANSPRSNQAPQIIARES